MGTSCLETDLGERTLPYSKSIQVNCPSLQMLFHKVPSSNPQAKRKYPLPPRLLCTGQELNWDGTEETEPLTSGPCPYTTVSEHERGTSQCGQS